MDLQQTQEKHSMVLATAHPSGADEWYCPICGRRFLLQMYPKYKKVVIEPGDEYAYHSASKGDVDMAFNLLDMGSTHIEDEVKVEPLDDKYLTPWKKWMEETDFERLWRT